MEIGIDLSHHQDPARLPWNKFEGAVRFVICRAAYGSGLCDRAVVAHMRRAREIGARVGLYLFYRPSQPLNAQWDLLRSVADQVSLAEGDIVPALDIERDPLPAPGTNVSPAWSSPCEEIVERIAEMYGQALVYITQREWGMLGKPQWVTKRPLWVAHYTSAPSPATPDNVSPTIWQYRVGPFDPNGRGGYDKKRPELDHNRALQPLPLICPTSANLPDEGLDDLRDQAALEQFDFTVLDENSNG